VGGKEWGLIFQDVPQEIFSCTTQPDTLSRAPPSGSALFCYYYVLLLQYILYVAHRVL
jgi:hypothetical protein